VDDYLASTRTGHCTVFEIALEARDLFAHSVMIAISKEELLAVLVGTPEEEHTLLAAFASHLVPESRLVQEECLLGLLAVGTNAQGPINKATGLIAYIGSESVACGKNSLG